MIESANPSPISMGAEVHEVFGRRCGEGWLPFIAGQVLTEGDESVHEFAGVDVGEGAIAGRF